MTDRFNQPIRSEQVDWNHPHIEVDYSPKVEIGNLSLLE